MALDKLTIIDGGGLSTTSDYRVGVITATKFVGPIEGAITSTDATFTGNVSIGGTLTYEDVTNIDSVGLVTARDGIFVPDDKSIRIGNTFANPDLKIFSSPTYDQAVIDYNRSGTGRALRIRSTNTQIENWNGLAPIAKFVGGVGVGHVELNYAGDKKFETTTKGIQVGTGVTIETNGQATFSGITTARVFDVDYGDATPTYGYFQAGRIKIYDNGSHCHLRFGSHPHYSPHQMYSASVVNRTNSYYMQNTGATRYAIGWVHGSDHASGQGSVNLYYSGGYAPDYSVKLSTHSGGVLVSGVTTTTNLAVTGVSTFSDDVAFTTQNGNNIVVDKSDNSLKFGDNITAKFGDNSGNGDLWIYHDTGHSYIRRYGAGNLRLTTSSGKIQFQKHGADTLAEFNVDGSIDLYYDGTKRLETTSTGVTISDNLNLGNETAAGIASPVELNLGGTYRNAAGGNSKLKLWSDGSDQMGFGVSANQLDLILTSNNYDFVVYSGNSGTTERFRLDGNTGDLTVTGDIHIDSAAGASSNLAANDVAWKRIEFDADYNSTPNGPNKILLHDDSSWKAGFGISTDSLDIYSGANIRLYGKATTHNAASKETLAEFLMDNAVKLYYDGTTKFETQSSGAMVLGALRLQGDNTGYITGQAQPLIYRTGSTSGSYPFNNFGHLVIQPRTDGSNRDIIFATGTSSANQIVINSNGDMKLPDGKELQFGGPLDSGDGDLRIHHNATHSFIQNATGDLNIQGDVVRIKKYDASKTMASFIAGGQAEFNYDSTRRLHTSPTGIFVTGEVAASQDYPTTLPTVDFNFAASKKLDPSITYTRTGAASFTNKFREIEIVGDNTPRFDYDPNTGESLGLLIEEERTNYNYYSDVGTNVLNNGVTTNFTTDFLTPEGKFGRCLNVQHKGGSIGGYFRRGDSIDITAGSKYTFSVFIRANGNDFDNSGFNSGVNGGVHLYRAGVGQNANFGLTSDDMKRERYAHGWTRYSCTFTAAATATAVNMFFSVRLNWSYLFNWNYQLWGFQIEESSYATSYIPTQGSTGTRGADIVLLDDIEKEMGYNQTEGTVVTDFKYSTESDGAHTIFSFSGTESNPADQNYRSWLRINKTAGTANAVRIYQNGDYDDSSSTATPDVYQKVAYAYSSTDQDVSLNGTSVTDASRTPPTNLFRLSLGNIGWNLGLSTTALEGHIKRFIYYPKKLSNNQLRNLTS